MMVAVKFQGTLGGSALEDFEAYFRIWNGRFDRGWMRFDVDPLDEHLFRVSMRRHGYDIYTIVRNE